MISIIFEAHATSLDNEVGLASGWNDIALSDLGELQARELGERYKDETFDAIFCSDLQRSYMTAHLAFGDRFPIIHEQLLRECNYGTLTQADKKVVNADKANRITTPFEKGESYGQCCARIRTFLDEIAINFADKHIMIIGHRVTQYGLEYCLNNVSVLDAVAAPCEYQSGWSYQMGSQ